MKHLKTSLQDLRDLFEHRIAVRYIAEKLEVCRDDEDAAEIRRHMEATNFDVLGIERDGVVYGYVERTRLTTGPGRDFHCSFHPSELIAESTPLIDLLPILRDTPRVFVLERNRVNGIVTRGDLQKAPVRMLLFALVTLLEMHFLRLIRIYYPRDEWQDVLKEKRLESAKHLWIDRQHRNEAIDLIDCLQFCDKRDLILAHAEIRSHMGFIFEKSGERFLKAVDDLRNKLAHAQDLVSGSSWADIIDLAKAIEKLLERCEKLGVD